MKTNPGLKPYTFITGASSGLGREIAIECARRGMNLILAALPGRSLSRLCADLSEEFGVKAVYYETDLTDKYAIYALAEDILAKYRVNFLVNNAGTGGTLSFDISSPEYLDNIIQLNIRAVSMLARLFIPELKSHPEAWILNVSSMAAFSPIPYKTIYPASKAFVHNFSRSLSQEMKKTSVKVAVVHPGPILTNPDVILRIIRQGAAGKVGLLQAREIARAAIDGVKAGRRVIVPGVMNKINRFLMRVVPADLRLNMLSRVIRREIEETRLQAA
ncbi:MAG: SDR family NAD(P)-dependent oxidoreductase [Methanoregulaceae archaeon]|nr:SDR family NAD(P)-dependent oxidoreductase [Methanoregulaceae archaeon]